MSHVQRCPASIARSIALVSRSLALLLPGMCLSAAAGQTAMPNPTPVNAGTVTVGQTSASLPVSFTIATSGTLTAPIVVTQGIPNLDYVLDAGSTCVGPVTAGTTCVVNVLFTPRFPGQRMGAVELTSANGVAGTRLLEGLGSGPQISYSPGTIATVAGNGTRGFGAGPDGGGATSANLNGPFGVAIDAAGNQYIADQNNHRVRKVTASTGVISTLAGTGTAGYVAAQDGGPAASAELNTPTGVALDGAGNVYIADSGNHRIRMVSASTGAITTVAGNGSIGYDPAQDGGPAVNAELFLPYGIAVDAAGSFYIADYGNERIRRVTADGIITTVAGNGTAAFLDNVPALSGEINSPYGVTVDSLGNLFIADTSNERIRRVDAVSGMITTVAGNGAQGFVQAQDGGPATAADLDSPYGVVVDAAGNVYFTDTSNQRIRKVSVATGLISTVAGSGQQGYGPVADGGPATLASLNFPRGLALNDAGDLYTGDFLNNRVRRISAKGALAFPTATPAGMLDLIDGTQTLTLSNTGNQPLTISAIAPTTPDFTLESFPGSCSTTAAVIAGGSCLLGVQFTPQTGNGVLFGTLNITDNVAATAALPAPVLTGATAVGALDVYVPSLVIARGRDYATVTVIVSYSGRPPMGLLSVLVNGTTSGVAATPVCVLKGSHENCGFALNPSTLPPGIYPISASITADPVYVAAVGLGTLTIQ